MNNPAEQPTRSAHYATAGAYAAVAGDFPGVLEDAELPGLPGPLADSTTPLAAASAARVRTMLSSARPHHLLRPEEPRVLVVANQKGGVGKTTTAVNIGAALAQHGLRVLVIDLDPQGNASTALGVDHTEGTAGIYEVLVDDVALSRVVCPAGDLPSLLVAPATIDLAGAEIELVPMTARESRLRTALEAYLGQTGSGANRIDYVLIDCPPSLGLLTVNALVAAREMLIPIQCEYYALEGLGQLIRNVDLIRGHLNPALQVSAILLTMHDARTRLSSGVAAEVRRHFGDVVLRNAIPRSVRVSEAPGYAQSVMTYDPTSPGALAYLGAARELASRTPAGASLAAG